MPSGIALARFAVVGPGGRRLGQDEWCGVRGFVYLCVVCLCHQLYITSSLGMMLSNVLSVV